MPTLAAVNLAFNSVYNCMAFWFQDSTDSKTGRYTDAAWWEPRLDCKLLIWTQHNITYYDLWTSDLYCNYSSNLKIYIHIYLMIVFIMIVYTLIKSIRYLFAPSPPIWTCYPLDNTAGAGLLDGCAHWIMAAQRLVTWPETSLSKGGSTNCDQSS